jgi:hypothetical protein
LKPQAFMRQIVRAALPLGEGVVLDPFMGGGSTIAAAVAVGYASVGVETGSRLLRGRRAGDRAAVAAARAGAAGGAARRVSAMCSCGALLGV